MDQDKELLRAMIERRQQRLAQMSKQIKNEHLGLDQQVKSLISALDNKELLDSITPPPPAKKLSPAQIFKVFER